MKTAAKACVAAMVAGLILMVVGFRLAAEGGVMKSADKVMTGEAIAFTGCAFAGAGLVGRIILRWKSASRRS